MCFFSYSQVGNASCDPYADQTGQIISTICQKIVQCNPSASYASCESSLQGGAGKQIWEEFSEYAIEENAWTAIELEMQISQKKITVNNDKYCECLSALNSISCNELNKAGAYDPSYENVENMIDDDSVCSQAFYAPASNGSSKPNEGEGKEVPKDNCPDVRNPDQADFDGNGVGNACQAFSKIEYDPKYDSVLYNEAGSLGFVQMAADEHNQVYLLTEKSGLLPLDLLTGSIGKKINGKVIPQPTNDIAISNGYAYIATGSGKPSVPGGSLNGVLTRVNLKTGLTEYFLVASKPFTSVSAYKGKIYAQSIIPEPTSVVPMKISEFIINTEGGYEEINLFDLTNEEKIGKSQLNKNYVFSLPEKYYMGSGDATPVLKISNLDTKKVVTVTKDGGIFYLLDCPSEHCSAIEKNEAYVTGTGGRGFRVIDLRDGSKLYEEYPPDYNFPKMYGSVGASDKYVYFVLKNSDIEIRKRDSKQYEKIKEYPVSTLKGSYVEYNSQVLILRGGYVLVKSSNKLILINEAYIE